MTDSVSNPISYTLSRPMKILPCPLDSRASPPGANRAGETVSLTRREADGMPGSRTETVLPVDDDDAVMGVGELAKAFRTSRPDCRILLMTGFTPDADFPSLGLSQIPVQFIQKPFSPSVLAKAVDEAFVEPMQPPPA